MVKQTSLRLNEELKDAARIRAITLKKSFNDYVVNLIETDLERATDEAIETIKEQVEEEDEGPR